MKVYLSADMEGASGISAFNQVKRNSKEFEAYRRTWTMDINQLVEGAIAGGADEIHVNEGHDEMNYIYPDLIHPKARLIEGRLKSKNQMEGIDDSFDVAFILCHARAGQQGVLSHSFIAPDIWEMRLNGEPIGEVGLNMVMASQFGVPVGLIIGDDTTYAEAKELVPNINAVVTKDCITQFTANCRSHEEVMSQLYAQAEKTVKNAKEFALYKPKAPYTLDVTFTIPAMTELISYIPGVKVTSTRSVSFTSDDYFELTRVRILIVNLTRMIGDQLR